MTNLVIRGPVGLSKRVEDEIKQSLHIKKQLLTNSVNCVVMGKQENPPWILVAYK